jgi:hypothetical protein
MPPAAKTRLWIKLWRHSLWSDPALQVCSKSAQWFWIKLFTTVMEDATPYGHLLINGKPATLNQLAAIAGEPIEIVGQWLQELETNGVYSRTPEGVVYSRKMVTIARLSAIRGAAGHLGGNPVLLNQKDKQTESGLLIQKVNPRGKSTRGKNVRTPLPPLEGGQEPAEKKPRRSLEQLAAIDAHFERFWKHYPRGEDKQQAKDEWRKIKPDPDAAFTDRCIAVLERQKRSDKWLEENGKFIVYAVRWIKRRKWEDEVRLPLGRAGGPDLAGTRQVLDELRQVRAERAAKVATAKT